MKLDTGLLTYRASAERGHRPGIQTQVTPQLEAAPAFPAGIIFAVTGLPNQDVAPNLSYPNGVEAIGGMGESYFATVLTEILLGDEAVPIEFGTANRQYFQTQVHNQEPTYTGNNIEELYELWRKNAYSVEMDRKLDEHIRTMAIQSATEKRFAVVSSKIFSLLYLATQSKNPELSWPTLITIGVDANQDTALKRATFRRLRKRYPNYESFLAAIERMTDDEQMALLLETIEARQNRYQAERNNLAQAYPETVANYSRQTMLDVADFVFDNSADFRDVSHLKTALQHLLAEIVFQVPQLAMFLLPAVSYRVSEYLRIKELRYLMLQPPTEENLKRAWIAWLEKDLIYDHLQADLSELGKLSQVSFAPVLSLNETELASYPLLQSFYRSFHLEQLLANGWIETNFDSKANQLKAEEFMISMIAWAQDED